MLATWIQGDHLLPMLTGIVSSIALSYFLARFIWAPPLRHVPGPRLNKYLGIQIAVAELRGQRSKQILAWHRKYGPVVCIAPTQVSIASSDAIREIYGSTGRADKSAFFNHFVTFDSRSVFTTLSFAEHKRKRAVISAFYQGSNFYVQPVVETLIHDRVFALLSQIECGSHRETPEDFYSFADWYAFDNITALVLGPLHASTATKLPGEERRILRDLKRAQGWSPVRQRFPWLIPIVKSAAHFYNGDTGQFDAERSLGQWVYDRALLTLQDQHPAEFESLVAYLARKLSLNYDLKAPRDSSKNHVSEAVRYIAAEALDNINAAEASVAATITYVVWYLSIHPEWQQRLRTELLALPTQSNGLPSFTDIDHAPILDACLKEVYRLKPASGGRAERVVPAGGRVVSNIYLPAKTVVMASIIAVHADPTIFTDEADFRPSRWLGADEATLTRLSTSVLPFGYGARICLGKAVANMEIKILLAALFLRYEIVPAGTHTGEWMTQALARDGVRSGLRAKFQFRRPSVLN